jgi:hypothetical protein
MIQLNKKSFLSLGEETQTSKKVELLSVVYNHHLGQKSINETQVPQGYVKSFVYDEAKKILLENLQEDNDFNGNILIQLTDNYIAKLKALNSDIVFTNTLK